MPRGSSISEALPTAGAGDTAEPSPPSQTQAAHAATAATAATPDGTQHQQQQSQPHEQHDQEQQAQPQGKEQHDHEREGEQGDDGDAGREERRQVLRARDEGDPDAWREVAAREHWPPVRTHTFARLNALLAQVRGVDDVTVNGGRRRHKTRVVVEDTH